MGHSFATAANVSRGNAHDHTVGDGAKVPVGGLTLTNAQALLATGAASGSPSELTVAEQTLVGRITGGNLAALTGTQVGKVIAKPSFSAYLSATQSGHMTSDTYVILPCDTEEYDSDNWYNNTGAGNAYAFTPQVAGKYLFIMAALIVGTTLDADKWVRGVFYKNGVLEKAGPVYFCNIAGTAMLAFYTASIQCNGSSDYIQAYARQNDSQNLDLYGGPNWATLFQGFLVSA